MEKTKATPSIKIEDIFTAACKLPYCKVERGAFLTSQLSGKISELQLKDALENGTTLCFSLSIRLLLTLYSLIKV